MKIGSTDITAAYLGSTSLSKVYVGSTEVWSSYSYLLDTYTGAAAAYSLRQLRSAYTGSAIKVRRASDNTEQDIGFSNNELDTTTLASFCSGTNGFVTTWYDQSGNGADLTQVALADQPKIYDNTTGVVLGPNSKPSIEGDGGSYLRNSVVNFGAQPFTHFAAFTQGATTSVLCDGIGGQRNQIKIGVTSNNEIYAGAVRSFSAFASGDHLITALFNGTSSYVYADGSQVLSPSNAGTQGLANGLTIMAEISAALRFVGYLPEYILYSSDQSSNRTGIETNINDYYAIY